MILYPFKSTGKVPFSLVINFSLESVRLKQLNEWEWISRENNCKNTKLLSQQGEMFSYKYTLCNYPYVNKDCASSVSTAVFGKRDEQ